MKVVGERRLSKVFVFYFFIFGLWSKFQPKSCPAIVYHLYSYIMHFTLSFCYSGFMVVSLVFITDVNEVTLSICVTFTMLAYCVKILNFYWNNDGMKECLATASNFVLENDDESEFLEQRMFPFQRLALIYYTVPNLCGVTAYLKPLFATKTELPFLGWYPLDWRNDATDYWIVYVYQLVGILIEINLNVTMEMFPSYLMYLLSIQTEILGKRLERMASASNDNRSLMKDIRIINKDQLEVFRKLTNCMKLHQKMDQFAAEIESNFTLAFFAQICLSGSVMCSIAYQLTYTSPRENIFQYSFLISFLTGVVIQIFLPCYFGHEIMVTSDSLANSVYASSWHSFSLNYRKLTIIFMERLKRTRKLLVGKLFPLSLDTFTSIVYFAYRLYAVLGGT